MIGGRLHVVEHRRHREPRVLLDALGRCDEERRLDRRCGRTASASAADGRRRRDGRNCIAEESVASFTQNRSSRVERRRQRNAPEGTPRSRARFRARPRARRSAPRGARRDRGAPRVNGDAPSPASRPEDGDARHAGLPERCHGPGRRATHRGPCSTSNRSMIQATRPAAPASTPVAARPPRPRARRGERPTDALALLEVDQPDALGVAADHADLVHAACGPPCRRSRRA